MLEKIDSGHSISKNTDLFIQIRWIILARAIFAIVLIFSTLFFSNHQGKLSLTQPFLSLYNMAAVVLTLSIVYIFWLNQKKHLILLAYLQTIIDSILVTAIIFVTGSFESIFTFLYLVVIIYTSMLLLQREKMFWTVFALNEVLEERYPQHDSFVSRWHNFEKSLREVFYEMTF